MTVPLRPSTNDGDPGMLTGNRRRIHPRPGTALAFFLAAALLAGCAAAPQLEEVTAGRFQARVATAKQLAAEQNFPRALAELDELGREVQAAAEQGDVSPERRSRIESTIGKVRADLEAASAAVEPAPAPTPSIPDLSPGGGDREDAEEDGGKDRNKGKGKDD